MRVVHFFYIIIRSIRKYIIKVNLNLNIANNYKDKLEKYKSNIRLLNSNSISSNLKKGYSILMDKKKIVKTSKKITTDDQLSVKLIDGTIDIKVTKIN